MSKIRSRLIVALLAAQLGGCASVIGNADAGPDPGGGYYDGSNLNVGHINAARGGFSYSAYTTVGEAPR
jgi:uncharacterized protein YceK